MALLMNLSVVLAIINVLLILGLIFVYWKNAMKIRSIFTIGLLMFAILFLVHNILYLYFSITMMPYYADSVQGFVFVFNLLQAMAFTILNIITWK